MPNAVSAVSKRSVVWLGARSKTASTYAPGAPRRTSSADVRAPSTALSASMTIDLPAPVSPVSAFMPAPNSIRMSRITAKLRIVNSTSTPMAVSASNVGVDEIGTRRAMRE